MGLLNRELASAAVSFRGIQAYAGSGLEECPIRTQVEIEGADALYQETSALVVMLALGACRMAEMLNRMPQYMEPYMRLVGHVADGILESPTGSDFRVRDQVMTDSKELATWAQMSGDFTQAEVNGGLPVVSDEPGPVERETRLRLMERKSSNAPWASYKFKRSSANPLTTIGSWSAALEHCVREYPYEQVAQPTAAALTAVSHGWAALGDPPVIPAEPMEMMKGMTLAIAISDDPVEMAQWSDDA